MDLETSLPPRARLINEEELKLPVMKRRKNVFIPDGPGLEIVPYLEGDITLKANLPEGLLEFIKETLEKDDFNNCWSLVSMFAHEDALKILPTLE